jgi:hypothetical protein
MLAPERVGEDLTKTAERDEQELAVKSKEEAAREAAEDAAAAAAAAKARRVGEMDLFGLCAELGEKGKQYDAQSDSMLDTFVRGEDCLECIRQISRSG